MTDPVLSVRDLKVEFPTRRGTLTAIDGISFEIGAGEVLGVVGESGAGKSVTGAAIIGLIEPPGRVAGGEVRLRGRADRPVADGSLRRIRGKRIGRCSRTAHQLRPLYRIGDQLNQTITAHADMSAAAARRQALALLSEVGIPAPDADRQLSAPVLRRHARARRAGAGAGARARVPHRRRADTALDVSVQAQIIALLRRLCRERGTASC